MKRFIAWQIKRFYSKPTFVTFKRFCKKVFWLYDQKNESKWRHWHHLQFICHTVVHIALWDTVCSGCIQNVVWVFANMHTKNSHNHAQQKLVWTYADVNAGMILNQSRSSRTVYSYNKSLIWELYRAERFPWSRGWGVSQSWQAAVIHAGQVHAGKTWNPLWGGVVANTSRVRP